MAGLRITATAVLDAENKASKVLKQVEKDMKALGKATKVSADVGKLTKDLDRARESMRALGQVQKTSAAFDVAKTRMRDASKAAAAVRDAMVNVDKPTRAMEVSLRRAEAASKAARAAFYRQRGAMNDAAFGAAAHGVQTGNIVAEQRRLASVMNTATAAIIRQQRAERVHAAERQEYDRHVGRHGIVGTAAAAAAGAVSVHAIGHGVGETIRAGAKYQHERVALMNAGRTPHDLEEIDAASRATVRSVPTSTYRENLAVIAETTGAFGDLHHAIENLPFMQKSASVLHSVAGDKIHESAGELGNLLARFFEMRGTAGNTPVFQREAGEMIRAMASTRGTFNPREMLNFGQQAKASVPLYSERFLTKIAPSLVTEYGGDRAGTAANAFRNVVMGKANDRKQAEEWMRYGLLDPKQTTMKGGHAVGWRAGAVKGTNKALSDPLAWMEEDVLPAMAKKGVKIDDKLELSKALGTMFRNSNSNLFAEALGQVLSRQRLHKDESNINQADTLEGQYRRNLNQDPTAAMTALSASLDNLMTVASSPAMSAAASAITGIATGLNSLADIAKDHPIASMTAAGTAAVGAAGGSAYLSYKLLTGFGLTTSATALDASAAALTEAAVALGGQGILKKALPVAGGSAVVAGGVVGGVLAGGAALSWGATRAAQRDATVYKHSIDPEGFGLAGHVFDPDNPTAPSRPRGQDFTLGYNASRGFQTMPRTEVSPGTMGEVSARAISSALSGLSLKSELSGSAEVKGDARVDMTVKIDGSGFAQAIRSEVIALVGRLTAGAGPGGNGDSTASTRGGSPGGMGAAP